MSGSTGVSDSLKQMKPLVEPMHMMMLDLLREYVGYLTKIPWTGLADKIEAQIRGLETSNALQVKDSQHALFLQLSRSILGIYLALTPYFKKQQDLIDVIQKVTTNLVYREGIENYLERRFGIKSDFPELAWECVCTEFKARGDKQFGSAWHYEQGIKDDRRCFVNVTKCGFADFFIEHDARELVYVLCALDYVWGDELEKYGIRFERPTILPEGGEACRFQFFKIVENKELSTES